MSRSVRIVDPDDGDTVVAMTRLGAAVEEGETAEAKAALGDSIVDAE